MKPKIILCLALVLSGALMGCVTHREFRGSTTNLKGAGDQTSNTNFLKMSVECSGITTNGGNYIVFQLPEENCKLVLFYPKMKPYPYYYFRAKLDTNQIRAWQIEQSDYLTNHIVTTEELPQKQTDVWLVKGKQLNRLRLDFGPEGVLPASAERLHGQIEMVTDSKNREFHVNVDLSNGNGVKLSGIFDSYKELWPPLEIPYMIFVLPFSKE